MKFASDFDTFLRLRVNLSKARLNDLESRVAAIESFLASHDLLSDMFLDVIPTGSWAHRTIIRPVRDNDEFDADILLYVTEDSGWKPKDYLDNLHRVFQSSGTYASKAMKMTRCVRIDYVNDVHVDVVPYLERHGDHVITNRKEPEGEGSFELSNPEEFAAWVDERQRLTQGNFVKVVRLAKYLRDYKDTFSCKSIILTTLLGNHIHAYEEAEAPTLYADVPTALKTLMRRLADSLPNDMPDIYDPAGTGDNFSERYRDTWNYENFRKQIRNYADKIDGAYESTDAAGSTNLWREVFGDKFRELTTTTASAIAKSNASATQPWDEEQFIHLAPFGFPVRLEPGARLRISARCTGLKAGQYSRKNGFRQFDLAKQGNRVKKNRNIKFSATTSVEGARLYWKVRNGGPEAAAVKGGLRGEIRADLGQGVRTESTSYRGTHYVECYAVKDGVVVAMDHQSVIVED